MIRSSFSFSAAAPDAAGRPTTPVEADERVERDEPGRAVAVVVEGRARAVVALGVVEEARGLRTPAPAVVAERAAADERGGLAVETIPPAGRSRVELIDERRGARLAVVEPVDEGGGLVVEEVEAEERVEGRRACPAPGAGAPVEGGARRIPLVVDPAAAGAPGAAVRLTPPIVALDPTVDGLPAVPVAAPSGRRVVAVAGAAVGGAPGRGRALGAEEGGRVEGRFVAVPGLVGGFDAAGATSGTGGARDSGSAAPLVSGTGVESAAGGGADPATGWKRSIRAEAGSKHAQNISSHASQPVQRR